MRGDWRVIFSPTTAMSWRYCMITYRCRDDAIHRRSHSLTHSRTHARTNSLTHSLAHSLTHSLTHTLSALYIWLENGSLKKIWPRRNVFLSLSLSLAVSISLCDSLSVYMSLLLCTRAASWMTLHCKYVHHLPTTISTQLRFCVVAIWGSLIELVVNLRHPGKPSQREECDNRKHLE